MKIETRVAVYKFSLCGFLLVPVIATILTVLGKKEAHDYLLDNNTLVIPGPMIGLLFGLLYIINRARRNKAAKQ